jgi:hypothetical protein
MIYLQLFFSYLSRLFQSASSSVSSEIKQTFARLLPTDAYTGSNSTPHTLHQAANTNTSLQQNMVSHQGNRTSNQTSMGLSEVDSNEGWHAWFDCRRAALKVRLKQAEAAEWNWPSTRARCEVMRIEDEIAALDAEEFIVPNFTKDISCAFKA